MHTRRNVSCLRTVQSGFRVDQLITAYHIYRNYCGYGHGTALDYYAILGIQRDATQRQIKAAYYKLSKKYHPDTAEKICNAQTKFVEINEAYECLRDPNKRRAYDNQTTGGGGRYTGDAKDPFMGFQWKSQHFKQRGNPFHDKRFSQEEYERVWQQFHRMKNERESYDARLNYERREIWEEFARRRAKRWREFHERYPDGPPGSIKWDWSWSSDSNKEASEGFKVFRRIFAIYMACFFTVSLVQALFMKLGDIHSLSDEARKRRLQAIGRNKREEIEEMMSKHPSDFTTPKRIDYIYQMPNSMNDTSFEIQDNGNSDAVYSPQIDNLGSNDHLESEFSMYNSLEKNPVL